MQTAKRLEGIGEYYFSKKLREIDGLNKEGKNIINLGIGSPDLPPHPDVVKVLQEESMKPAIHGYQSYKGSPVLRNAMRDWYKKWYNVSVDADTELLPLIGSKEGIMHICMTYFEPGVKVLVPNPGYPTYSSAIKLSGAEPEYYNLLEANSYEPDFAALEVLLSGVDNINSQLYRGIFVNYPQMPTGQLPSQQLFENLVQLAKKHGLLIIHDNPYSFILNDKPASILSVPGAKEVAIELNSLSKSHNMAGWRVGMLCGDKKFIDDVLRFKSNMDSGMFLPLQLAAAKALSLEQDWYDKVNEVYKERRLKVQTMLDLLGCTVAPDQAGMFVWAKPKVMDYPEHELGNGGYVSDNILYNANVFITPGGIFGSAGNGFIRVSLCSPVEKLDEAINRIKQTIL